MSSSCQTKIQIVRGQGDRCPVLLADRMEAPGDVDHMHIGMLEDQGLLIVIVQHDQLSPPGVILPQERKDRLFQQLHAPVGGADAAHGRGIDQPRCPAAALGAAGARTRHGGRRRLCPGAAQPPDEVLHGRIPHQLLEGGPVGLRVRGDGDYQRRERRAVALGVGQDGAERLALGETDCLVRAGELPVRKNRAGE